MEQFYAIYSYLVRPTGKPVSKVRGFHKSCNSKSNKSAASSNIIVQNQAFCKSVNYLIVGFINVLGL